MCKITFKINGEDYEADERCGPDMSLNEYIRTIADLRGTKVMCQEGGCGACVVSVRAAFPPTNKIQTLAVNSCLISVLSCHGWEITTVEGVGNKTDGYHKIQSTLAGFNGTQCGYCTPGMVMNMYSLYTANNEQLTMADIENSFAGNICRCTGYRPIIDAFKSLATDADECLVKKLRDIEDLSFFKSCGVKCNKSCSHKNKNKISISRKESKNDWCLLDNDETDIITVERSEHTWYKVYSLSDLFTVLAQCNNDYRMVAGNTGQGVYPLTSGYPKNVIDILSISDIKGYIIDENLILGAGMPLTEMMEVFDKLSSETEDFIYLKELHTHMDLVAHVPVRNFGTIGGNLFMRHENHDFPSDLFLIFETVGAMITIASSTVTRRRQLSVTTQTISLLDFLELDMNNKIITKVILPPLSRRCLVKTYKIMPRAQNAHAIVNAGFMFEFKKNEQVLEKATIVFGHITSEFIHATNTEAALVDKNPFTDEVLQLALQSLSSEIIPEAAPPEPSPEYRKLLAMALYYKAILYLCPKDKLDSKYTSGGEVIKRQTSKGTQVFETDETVWPLNKPVPKLEAMVQCGGEGTFANDLPVQTKEVFGAFVLADVNPGSIISGFDTTEAFKIPGVIAFYSAKDIPGDNNFTPTLPFLPVEEEIICSKEIKFHGQPVGIIVARREKTATNAAKLVKVNYEEVATKTPLLTIPNVLSSSEQDRVTLDIELEPTDTGSDVKLVVNDELYFDSQYHYHMEPQTCVVKPSEEGLEVYSATQWLDVTNIAIAKCLNVPVNSVNVIVRRIGGAYGAKISRSAQIACAAALVTHLSGKTCRFILPIKTNMKAIGKRAPTYSNVEAGVNAEGRIQYFKIKYYQDNGCSKNDTFTSMTMGHFPNCYDSSRWHIEAYSVLTDTASTTWCRAPASCEGIAITEHVMERVAHELGKDPLEVRLQNMSTKDNPVPELIEKLKTDSNYDERLVIVKDFNKNNRWRKRAINILPMTYELSYVGPYNCIVSIFHGDGSVAITHGGTEMGQGINTKVAQVCAYILQIPLEKVSVKPSSSFTSPNCMATGASVGSECVSYACMKSCEIINERLKTVREGLDNPTWEEVVEAAYGAGVDLQASYMYSTNEPITHYEIYGVIILEVEVDILTGNHEIIRVDLLEDTGRSLSPEIDISQIEGAFVMGLGYWTIEKLEQDASTGELLTNCTWSYKPPGIKDIPADFRVYFRSNSGNANGVLQSKATGEPAFCLAVVIAYALREAIRAARLDAGYEDKWISIGNPLTAENIFMAVGHELEHFKLK